MEATINTRAMALGDVLKSSYKFRARANRIKSNPVLLDDVRFGGRRQKGGPLPGKPTPGTYLIVKTSVKGNSGVWKQSLHLLDPAFVKNATRGFDVPVELFGEDYFMRAFDAKSPIRMKCTCPDFRHRFSWPDADVKSLLGQRIPYTKKTDRAPLNPENLPGFCKHILATFEFLEQPEIGVIAKGVINL